MKFGQDRISSHPQAYWLAHNRVLYEGEMAIDAETGRMKYGDGVTDWLTLPYTDAGFATGKDVDSRVQAVTAQLQAVQTAVSDAQAQQVAIQAKQQQTDAAVTKLQQDVAAITPKGP